MSFLSLGVGTIGIILPILPTTPFFLFSLYLFSKSSDRFYDWITKSSLYKKYIQSFYENKEMSFKHKWILLITVDVMLLVSFLQLNNAILKAVMVVLFIYKHYYFKTHITVI